MVLDIVRNSTAAKAGLKNNDIVLELSGKKVSNNPAEFIKLLGSFKAGELMDIVVLRNGKRETLKGVSLPTARHYLPYGYGYQPANPNNPYQRSNPYSPCQTYNTYRPAYSETNRLGVQFAKPNATLVEQLGLPKDQGLVLRHIVTDSAAAKAGLKNHDILLEFGGKKVSSNPADFSKQLRLLQER